MLTRKMKKIRILVTERRNHKKNQDRIREVSWMKKCIRKEEVKKTKVERTLEEMKGIKTVTTSKQQKKKSPHSKGEEGEW